MSRRENWDEHAQGCTRDAAAGRGATGAACRRCSGQNRGCSRSERAGKRTSKVDLKHVAKELAGVAGCQAGRSWRCRRYR